MSELDMNAADAILAACRANATSAAASLASCFTGQWEIEVEDGAVPLAEFAPLPAGPGLVLVFKLKSGAATLFWAESTGLLPDWYQATDATARAKLTTLAQELGIVLLPEDSLFTEFAACPVADLSAAWKQAAFAEDGGVATLSLTCGDLRGKAHLAWLAMESDALLPPPLNAEPTPAADPGQPSGASPIIPTFAQTEAPNFEESLAQLPSYMRSLLRIKVKLTVSLASTRQPVRRIVELGPGSIIQFNKRCDEPLELRVDGQEIAVGEAVKVGDKFGLRVSSMVLPKERFLPLGK